MAHHFKISNKHVFSQTQHSTSKNQIYIKKLNKWHPNANKVVHHNARTKNGAYIGLDQHNMLR